MSNEIKSKEIIKSAMQYANLNVKTGEIQIVKDPWLHQSEDHETTESKKRKRRDMNDGVFDDYRAIIFILRLQKNEFFYGIFLDNIFSGLVRVQGRAG